MELKRQIRGRQKARGGLGHQAKESRPGLNGGETRRWGRGTLRRCGDGSQENWTTENQSEGCRRGLVCERRFGAISTGIRVGEDKGESQTKPISGYSSDWEDAVVRDKGATCGNLEVCGLQPDPLQHVTPNPNPTPVPPERPGSWRRHCREAGESVEVQGLLRAALPSLGAGARAGGASLPGLQGWPRSSAPQASTCHKIYGML